jgi:hypothetical protein
MKSRLYAASWTISVEETSFALAPPLSSSRLRLVLRYFSSSSRRYRRFLPLIAARARRTCE